MFWGIVLLDPRRGSHNILAATEKLQECPYVCIYSTLLQQTDFLHMQLVHFEFHMPTVDAV